MSKLNLKDRLEDGELDLSMSDLEEVPVKEIISLKKAKRLDLSSNRITKLTKNFASMTHIVKLDLGKNLLTELPENFGDMVQLRHLDLYSNQIDRLPLSFGRLKNLRWLDLKGNPLVPKLAEVAGPCLDAAECAKCARAVVNLLHNMAVTIEEEKARRDQQRQLQQQNEALAQAESLKKENKKKKKGKGEHLDNAKKGNAVANKKGGNEKEMQKQQNGSGHKGKHSKEQKKARGFGVCAYMFLFLGLMLAIAGLALFFVDESLFWSYAKSSEIFCKDTFNSTRVWWETKGLQGVKDWAGGGMLALEAAKRTVLQLYASVSSQIPIYIESAKKMF